jgi:hypothetical protein
MAKTAIVHSRQRWEYQSVVKRTESSLEKDLNELGQAGWELVSVDQGKDRKGEMAWTAFLKRPAAPASPAGPSTAEQQPGETAPRQPDAKPAKADASASGAGFDLSGDEFSIKEEE